jgi:hypothetical protein
VDPRVVSEQSGLTSDSRPEGGASYLRNLKSQEGGNPLPAKENSSSTSHSSYPREERRRVPRYRCGGSVEFKSEGNDVRMWGTLTDISLHGCYVEMTTTFPVGTKVELQLESLGIRVHAFGVVRVSYPFLGMGISLTEIDPGQQRQLEQLLSALAGESPLPTPPKPATKIAEAVASSDPNALLEAIHRFFDKNKALTREEFAALAKRCRKK